MREIKFRGVADCDVDSEIHDYRVENGDTLFGQLVFDGDMPFIVGPVVEADEEYISLERWCAVRPESVGQFTGLKDKNGVEIYEGDVFSPGNIVEFCNGGYCINGDVPLALMTDFPVIGNVYENPELASGPSPGTQELRGTGRSIGEQNETEKEIYE